MKRESTIEVLERGEKLMKIGREIQWIQEQRDALKKMRRLRSSSASPMRSKED